ncbi:SDO1 [Hepatospora eriocheir]|uniref:SDO1 n=1 Tax=Hepatospora eriocheir TaxID=1081669 RepID=A0A1X0QG28_9MICR|nr:SDO1 [Hepatospora eriocheir]
MFLPSNNKKLVNISIITLKVDNFTYELAVYPNKLYEYFNDTCTDYSEILHNDCIYRNISKGELCSYKEIDYLKKSKNIIDPIKYILDNGYERKHSKTKEYEIEQIEKEVIEILSSKILYNNSLVDKDTLKTVVRGVYSYNLMNPKKQVSFIIKKLEEIGYKRVSFKVDTEKNLDEYKEFEMNENSYLLKGDVLHYFIEDCDKKNINFTIEKFEEVDSEDIC